MSLSTSGLRRDETVANRRAAPMDIGVLVRILIPKKREWSLSRRLRRLFAGVDRRRLRERLYAGSRTNGEGI